MSTSRDLIFSRVRSALESLPQRAPLPDWDLELAEAKKLVGQSDPAEVFAQRIKAVNGRAYTAPVQLAEALAAGGWRRGYCDPRLWPQLAPHFPAEFMVVTEYDRTRVDDYDFGITQAIGAVAESGTIILDDAHTSRRLAALAPWVHIALVPRQRIYPFLADALSALADDPNIIFVTGPSKTADVEGILIEGVHGPGQQWALLSD